MAHRQLLTDEERQALRGIPLDADSMARCFTLSRADRHLAAAPIASALPFSLLCFAIPESISRNWSSPSNHSFSGWQSSFMLDWLESPQLRQLCHAGLNKSEQRHALTQVICTFKQGRIADRGPDAQQFQASGLNVVIAAIVHWNSTYLADAVAITVQRTPRPPCRTARPYLVAHVGAHSASLETFCGTAPLPPRARAKKWRGKKMAAPCGTAKFREETSKKADSATSGRSAAVHNVAG
jgi:Tn3 transposase DDE domain